MSARATAPWVCLIRVASCLRISTSCRRRVTSACKLVLLRNHAGELLPLGPTELQLAAVTAEPLEFMVIALGSGIAVERFAVPVEAYHRVADDLETFRPAFPELFDHAYVNASRYLQ